MTEKKLREILKKVGYEKGMISSLLKPIREKVGEKRPRPSWAKLELLVKEGVPADAWFYIEKFIEEVATEEGETKPLHKAS